MLKTTGRPTLRQRLTYTVDLILSKGVAGVFLLAVIGTLLLLLVLVPILVTVQIVATNTGAWSDIPNQIWVGFAQVFKLGKAQGPWIDQLSAALVAIIGIFFTGILFGILIRSVSEKMARLRDTGGQIIARNHTAILGWSSIGETLLEQLAFANENQRNPAVAVLDSQSKLKNEEAIKFTDTRNTRVMFRKGRVHKPEDFDIIRVDLSNRVIIMADWGADNYDERIITSLLALSRYKEKKPDWNATVVAALKNGRDTASAAIAAEYPVVILDVGQFLTRLMLRTTLQPGLYTVYTDLFNFGKDELYFVHEPTLIGKTLGEALLAYPESAPVGIKTPDAALLHPDLDTVIGPEDQLVVIAHDDDTAVVGAVPDIDETTINATFAKAPNGGGTNWLFIGWSPALADVLAELSNYSTEPVSVELVCREDDLVRISDADTRHPHVDVTVSEWPNHVDPSTMLYEKKLGSFDYIVIFNQLADLDIRDSSTFMVMLQANAIAHSLPAEDRPAIVTELLEPKLRKLCKPGAGDIVVDSEMVALMTAQLSENPGLLPILVDLCDAAGSEIYLKAVGLYVKPGSMNYATLVAAARRRGEIAIGYRRNADTGNKKKNFGIMLNANKNTIIDVDPADQLIVLAADQF